MICWRGTSSLPRKSWTTSHPRWVCILKPSLCSDYLCTLPFHLEKKARRIENLQSRLDNCERDQKEMVECESPCTISRTENPDLISLSELENNNEKLQDENEMLSRQLEDLSETLNKFQNPDSEVEAKEERKLNF